MKFLEAHNGLSATLIDKSPNWDGIWISSLTHAAAKGLPDNELVPLKERVELLEEIRRLTKKPVIVDIDTGESIEHLPFIIHWFQRAGAYAVIMEDKKFPKQNSLLDDGKHELEDVDVFAKKVALAKKNGGEMRVFARLESLIAGRSMYDALIRAEAYINSGADGIMVHSKVKVDPTEVMSVGNELRKKYPDLTLIAVPTTYTLPEVHPFNITIKANHLMRASLAAMQKYVNGEKVELASVQDIFNIVGH
jgi:phosphoenolpyruvate phosphomutase